MNSGAAPALNFWCSGVLKMGPFYRSHQEDPAALSPPSAETAHSPHTNPNLTKPGSQLKLWPLSPFPC